MTAKKQRRLMLLGGSFVVAAIAVALTLTALRSSITFFYTPSDLAALDETPTRAIRLGGLVEDGSVEYLSEGTDARVRFAVTDASERTEVIFTGILPDLFREGQGVVVQGSFDDQGRLEAQEVLAKHDENYMPKEVADALKEQGHWKYGEEDAPSSSN
ncbi:MAG: cytochrome c maturation protein CcmE [Parvularculaceae bacterium]